MNTTGGQKVREIFAAAIEQAPEARAAYLAQVCGVDRELRTLIESLLEAHDRSAAFMPAFEPEAEAAAEPIGTEIGCYRLVEQLGEGGFGVVYRAEQTSPLRRQIALKIIKAGMDTKEVIARFDAERQALARMNHPNIARVIDAGATAQGRPYFVMELVEGVPITEYCDQHRLPTSERLELFVRVCQAVQHAHQKGIIHRDLKPTNILVTFQDHEAVPKVIDFGVAKALGPALTEEALETRCEQLIGTPAYMSPEQAELGGAQIDTRADIYSLGVLLYELLTGTTPFEAHTLKRAAFDEVRRLLRETEPPKPSTRLQTVGDRVREISHLRQTEPGPLNKLVRGDLDWIAMKALEKEPQRRYETANALTLDIERHLNHEPILARPPSTVYRLRKFVRRHRVGALAGSAVLLALCGGLATTLVAYLQVRKERDRAVAAEMQTQAANEKANLAVDMTRAVNDFLLKDLLEQASPDRNPDRNLTLRSALDRAAEKVGERFQANAVLEAVVRQTLGNTYRALGELGAAEEQLRRAYELRRQELGTNHETTIHAQIYLTLALIEQAQRDRGKVAEAEQMLKTVLETSRRTLGPDHLDTRGILHNLALACIETGRTVEGLRLCEQILELHRQAGDTNADHTLDTRDNLAMAYLRLGRPADAEPLQRAVLERGVQRNGREHPNVLITLENLGCTLEALGRYSEAESIFCEVVAGRRRVLGSNHPLSRVAVRKLALTYATLGDWPQCLALALELVQLEPDNLGSRQPAYIGAWLAGDTNTCREQLEALIRQFPWTNNPIGGKGLALDCLILPEIAPTLEPALQAADTIAQQQPDWPYHRIVKALADYRRGRWAESAEWIQPWQRHNHVVLASRAGYILALARHRLGETQAARAELDRANRRFDAFLRAGNLAAARDDEVRWLDLARLAILRAEAERMVLGREVSPRLDAASLRAAREHWAPVQQALDNGNHLAGARKWSESRDAFVRALEHPAFDWSVAEACDPEAATKIGLAFLRVGDVSNLERLCQSVFDRTDRTDGGGPITMLDIVNPITLAGVAYIYLLKPEGRSPELTRRAIAALDWAEAANVDPGVRVWLRLIRGVADYRSGQDADAVSALLEAEESGYPVCRGAAKVFRALVLQRLGQTQEAEVLLSGAETILSKQLEDRPYDWRYWHGLDQSRLALDEAHQVLHLGGHR